MLVGQVGRVELVRRRKRGHGPSTDGRCRNGAGRVHKARRGKKFLAGRPAGWLGAYRYMSDWATHTLAHTTLPRSIGPKPGPVKPLTRKQAVKSGALCPLPAFPAGPKGQQVQAL